MKAVNYAVLVLFGAVLILGGLSLPDRGDPTAPLNRDKSAAGTPNAPSYYIRNPERDADTPNMVTVILTAGLICFLILRRERTKEKRR